jgi:hypothetical protein
MYRVKDGSESYDILNLSEVGVSYTRGSSTRLLGQVQEGDHAWYIQSYMIVVYYSNTCHVFPRHLHHDMTTEDTLRYSKMGQAVLDSMMAWLRSCADQAETSRGGLSSRLTAPNHQPVFEHALAHYSSHS